MSAAVVAGCAALGVVAGLLVPAIVRRLPVPSMDGAAEDEAPPDYVALAAFPRLGAWAALAGLVSFGLLGLLAPAAAFPSLLVVAVAALPLTYVDLRVQLLPERIMWPTAAVVVAVLVVQAAVTSRFGALLVALLVAVACFVVFFGLAIVAGGGFGFGDVQLVTVLGLSAAWVSAGTAVLAVVLAILSGGLASVLLLMTRRIERGQAVPFGPFVLLGWWGAMLLTSTLAPLG